MTPHTPEGTVGRLTREQVEDLRVRMHSSPHIDTGLADMLCDMALHHDSSGEAVLPTADQISKTLQTFRAELDKNMHNSSGSPGHDAMTVALHQLFSTLPTLPAAEGWVSVETRTPDAAGEYLCWFECQRTILYYCSPQGWHWGSGDVMLSRYQKEITHWQPLPAPPAAGEV